MNKKWKRGLIGTLLLALPLGLGWIAREQRSWMPQVIYQAKGVEMNELVISPDGNTISFSEKNRTDRNSHLVLIDAWSGKLRLSKTSLPFSEMTCLSPDGKQRVIATEDVKEDTLRLSGHYHLTFFDSENGKVLKETITPLLKFPPNNNSKYHSQKIVWPAQSNRIVGIDGIVMEWNAYSGKLIRTSSIAHEELADVDLSPDGKMIAGVNWVQHYVGSVGEGKFPFDYWTAERQGVRLWDAHSGKLLRTLDQKHQSRFDVAFSHDGKFLASDVTPGEGGILAVQLWNPSTGRLLRTLKIPTNVADVYTIQFSPAENLLMVVGHQGNIFLWNAETGQLERTLKNKNYGKYYTTDTRFSPNGKSLFAARTDGAITRWRIR